MSSQFDPYYEWLGIPPEEQPADYYRLLGVQRFEANLNAISNAADARMGYVRTFQAGKNSAESQRILNELATARGCLLSPATRAVYDAQLQARLNSAIPKQILPVAAVVVPRPVPPRTANPATNVPVVATLVEQPGVNFPQANFPQVNYPQPFPTYSTAAAPSGFALPPLWVLVVSGGVVLFLGSLVIAATMSSFTKTQPVVAQAPAPQPTKSTPTKTTLPTPPGPPSQPLPAKPPVSQPPVTVVKPAAPVSKVEKSIVTPPQPPVSVPKTLPQPLPVVPPPTVPKVLPVEMPQIPPVSVPEPKPAEFSPVVPTPVTPPTPAERPKFVGRRFIDRGEIVEDQQTGLLWQKDGSASGKHNYYQAADYAAQLRLGKLTGWRVPTAKEFKEIFPATDAPFTNTKYNPNRCCKDGEFNSYWTCDLDGPKEKDYAFIYQWYADGGANNCFASRNFGLVRCVHDPVARPDPVELAKPLDPLIAKRVDTFVQQLGSPEFSKREAASVALKKMGAKIHPKLEQALKENTDPEILERIKNVLSE